MLKITYRPLNEFMSHGDTFQYCAVAVNEKELQKIVHSSRFFYDWTKEPNICYECYGFDCQDKDYDKKLEQLNTIAAKYKSKVIENEDIFFCVSGDTDAATLVEINSELEVLFNDRSF